MTDNIELKAFFEREDGSHDRLPAESYVAGFRKADGNATVAMSLPAETVEHTVLTGARLSLSLALDGQLMLDGEGLSDAVLEAASNAGALGERTLVSLVAAAIDPKSLDLEDDPVADLTVLRAQLAEALTRVDQVIERLTKE